jgi:phenylpropionate dioxygenase-like ring-hydroxylating dioxygenase large terminal subunit
MGVADDVAALLRRSWHPVCTMIELAATEGGRGPLPVRLCGEDLVVADLGDGPVALRDRCLHRSTRLSAGWVDGPALQCAYHGWRWDGEGRCVGVPSLPGAKPGSGLTARRIAAYQAEVAYDLVWVRLEGGWPTRIPPFPDWYDAGWRTVAGAPYTWPVSAERRVENYTDLAHFAWVHDGSLGDRGHPEVPVPPITRRDGALHFHYDPPAVPDSDPTALVGASTYRVSLPGTVHIEFDVPGVGARSLWMTASPIDDEHCRTFWFTCRTDDLEGDDQPHLDFQALVLDEDLPVIAAQHPPGIPWTGDDAEVSVATDAVSIAYRRFIREAAAATSPDALAEVLVLGRVLGSVRS